MRLFGRNERSNLPLTQEKQPLHEIYQALIKDFRLTYRFSQGNPKLQGLLMLQLRDYYSTQPEVAAELPSALHAVGQQVTRLTLPHYHKELQESAKITEDFSSKFDHFQRCLSDPTHMPFDADGMLSEEVLASLPASLRKEFMIPEDSQGRLDLVIKKMIEQDYRYISGEYITTGRPTAGESGDPYESFFRTYVLAGADTRSPAFNAIFQDARAYVATQHTTPGLEALQAAWGEQHPDEPEEAFYPSAFLELVANSQSS